MLSVIIPTHNRQEMLRQAVVSVLSQDVFRGPKPVVPFELLVVDDGSTDRTEDVVREMGRRVRYHFRPHGGVSAARNAGLALARGEMIAFLDSDDLWLEDKIRVQLNFMKTFPRAAVCYTEERWIRHGRPVNPCRKHRKPSGWIFEQVLPLCLLSLSSALFRRQVFERVGGFDESLPACEDYDLGIRIAQRYPIHLISRPLIVKRGGHGDQLSHRHWGLDRFRVASLEKALNLELSLRQRELVRREIVRKCRILAAGFRKRGNVTEAETYERRIDLYTASLASEGGKKKEKT